MTLLWWLPFQLLWWAIQIAIKIPTMLLGFLVTPFLYKKRFTPLDQMPFWSKPWVNPEDWHGGRQGYDGSLPTWWIERRGGESLWDFYKYHAIRNPADGLRNFKILNLQVNPDKIKYITPEYQKHYEPWYIKKPGVYGYAAWQTLWLGVKIIWIRESSYSEFKFGFRIEPGDAHGNLDPNGSRAIDGASFASKFIPNREY